MTPPSRTPVETLYWMWFRVLSRRSFFVKSYPFSVGCSRHILSTTDRPSMWISYSSDSQSKQNSKKLTDFPAEKGCPGYDTKLNLIVRLWEVWNIPSLALLPGPHWPEVVVPVWIPSIGQLDLFSNYLY